MLQALNILENIDLKVWASIRQIHPYLISAMNLSFADRDFYYGDPAFSLISDERIASKEYAKEERRRSTGRGTIPKLVPVIHILLSESNPLSKLFEGMESGVDWNVPTPLDENYLSKVWAGTTSRGCRQRRLVVLYA